MADSDNPDFVSLGMFIIDEFSFSDENNAPTGKTLPRIGGGGTYATIGARIWLPPHKVGMIVDRGNDFPQDIQDKLLSYGSEIWHFRDHHDRGTTRALNSYRGDFRGSQHVFRSKFPIPEPNVFQYLTDRIRLTPTDLRGTRLARPTTLHFICSPTRALDIISEAEAVDRPIMIFEPIPDKCIPEELEPLKKALPSISVLSPNADEALALLSITSLVTRETVEHAAAQFLGMGVSENGTGAVVIRSGALGAYVATRERGGKWIDAFWTHSNSKVVDVTGAGNSFLGGLAAGLVLADRDIYEAAFYASVSASFAIEQGGLPSLTVRPESGVEEWNVDVPQRRLDALRQHQLAN
ncbi:Ribokinase-like protein [Phlebopus sp. FC_14]|nr:Ribokinase-like protein [Phlebopus sp. FC_14]